MFRKVLLYGLPVYLYGLEIFLRTLANVGMESLAGPTLAGAGMAFLLPLTELKQLKIDEAAARVLAEANAKAYSARDKVFSDFVWLAFFLSLAGWMYALFRIMRPLPAPQSINWSFASGCAVFVVSIVLSEIKERL